MLARALQKFADWALSKNPPGGYAGEDDKRWAYTIETDGDPYLTRVLLSRVLGLKDLLGIGVYLHKFHRADNDQYFHNHPWEWAFSIVLTGCYLEFRFDDKNPNLFVDGQPTRQRVVRLFNKLTKSDYHRIDFLDGEVWTLFITGPRVQDWGFLVDGKHVSWREFLGKADAS